GYWRGLAARNDDLLQQQQQQQHRFFSTQHSSAITHEKEVPVVGGHHNGQLVSIHDHLDELHQIPLEDVRNFCIIAHVDHGKSSLASRVLEYTGNMGPERQLTAQQLGSESDESDNSASDGRDTTSSISEIMHAESSADTKTSNDKSTTTTTNTKDAKEEITLLDTLAVERERGITVKASAASMLYRHPSATNEHNWILLNMVDTPGHADFGMEVSKSLDSVEGAVLLFDAAQGVQAQTLSVYDKAKMIGRQRRKGSGAMLSSSGENDNGDYDDVDEAAAAAVVGGEIKILPALTKVDMPSARPLEVALAVSDLMGFDPDDILETSARTRIGIKDVRYKAMITVWTPFQPLASNVMFYSCTNPCYPVDTFQLLDSICEKVPPPEHLPDDNDDNEGILRAKVIDSWFETKRGVIALVRVLSGKLEENDRISIVEPASYDQIAEGAGDAHTVRKDNFSVQESEWKRISQDCNASFLSSYLVLILFPAIVGMVMPHRIRTRKLTRGQMGYVIAGLRDPREARPGAILSLLKTIPSLIGNKMSLPPSVSMGQHSVLYASVHPMEGEGFDELFAAVSRLALSDAGLEIQQTAGSSSGSGGGPFLGPGLRVGFQGLLHVEVFRQRLEDEFHMEAIVTPPKVPYTIQYLPSKNHHRSSDLPTEVVIEDLIDWPGQGHRYKVLEPMVDVRVLAPMEYAGNIMELIKRKRGTRMETKPIDEHTWQTTSSMPWGEVVIDFHDELKSTSAGYASFDVSESNPPQQAANLCKVNIMLNSEVVDPLSFVCHVDAARSQGRVVCEKLQEVLPRQQFVTVIQAKAEGRIIASERIQAYRKDVLMKGSKKVGGGDVTRKKKLLEKQKRGKKRQQSTGKVTLSQAAFRAVISRSG
ncbi:hypothetical protein ACHAXR_007546, partial [Thalassiosira sp. AJA248-18]